jgi:hypothetical protein
MTIDPFSTAIISGLMTSFGKVLGEAGLKVLGKGGITLAANLICQRSKRMFKKYSLLPTP